jgi:GT2 family glycosyltransferase
MPAVSIIIPAYDSHRTVRRCLEALRGQTWQDFEVIIVDSSPTFRLAEILRDFPEVRLIRSKRRLLPFAARNVGIRSAKAAILVSTDPDVYPVPDWLERLVACHRRDGRPVAGSVMCFGPRLFDWGVHFCKYHECLPYEPARPKGVAASANLLLTRDMYDALDLPRDDVFCGDYLFTRALVDRGHTPWFEPAARVSHHHIVTWRYYLAERYLRGRDFGETRAAVEEWSRMRRLLWLLVSIFPVRLASLLARTAGTARRGGVLPVYCAALPVVGLGFAAWLVGEAAAYAGAFGLRRRPFEGRTKSARAKLGEKRPRELGDPKLEQMIRSDVLSARAVSPTRRRGSRRQS